MDDSLDELGELARTAGVEVRGRATQRMRAIHPALFIGEGKVQELLTLKAQLGYDLVIFDSELSPRQLRNLEDHLDVAILDRTALILDIFAHHARTREGALQVELAQYEYRLSRLTRRWTHLSRQGVGGVGLRGPGETQLESDRRDIRRRIGFLKAELQKVRTHRSLHRRNRQKHGMPVVAIVGYTNAGKSTLLNSLSESTVLAADQLFATLDPTTRRVDLAGGRAILLTDTVGFIQKLPTSLVAAFRATLEEVTEADILIHVVDITHTNAHQHVATVLSVLEDLKATNKPTVMALNKIDRLPEGDTADRLRYICPDGVAISALRGVGLDVLLRRVQEVLDKQLVDVTVLVPYALGKLLHQMHARGVIEREEHREGGTYVVAKLPADLAAECRFLLSE